MMTADGTLEFSPIRRFRWLTVELHFRHIRTTGLSTAM
jgi:hypothetical protein